MNAPAIDIGAWFKETVDIVKENYFLLLVVNALMVVISVISAGILSGAMMAGVAMIMLRLLDKDTVKPEIGDVFKGFDFFLPALLFYLMISVATLLTALVIPFFGGLVCFSILQALCVFSIFFIVEKKMDFWPAIVASYQQVKDHFFPMLGFVVVINIVSMLGGLACGVGGFLTLPVAMAGLAVAYRKFYPKDGPVIDCKPLAESAEPE